MRNWKGVFLVRECYFGSTLSLNPFWTLALGESIVPSWNTDQGVQIVRES